MTRGLGIMINQLYTYFGCKKQQIEQKRHTETFLLSDACVSDKQRHDIFEMSDVEKSELEGLF